MARHRIVVQRQRPWLRIAGWSVLGLMLLTGIGLLVRFLADPETRVFRDADSELETLRSERRGLVRELRAAQAELESVKGRATFEARGCEIDVQACDALRRSLTRSEHEVADLREQLAFYRNIVSPEQTRAGVRVLRLAVRAGSAPGLWRYDLVLVQPVRRDRTATGSYDFALEGLIGGQLQTFALTDLLLGDAPEPRFAFRSFQEFSGEMQLPAGFLPSRLTVTLEVQDGRADAGKVSESFDWSRLVAAGKE